MAVLDHDDLVIPPSENHCAVQFCLTWVGFFVIIGAMSWILTSL